jgi:hypothetical protein
MKTKHLVATVFLFAGLLASVSLSGCSFGGHVTPTSSHHSSLIE